MAYSIRELDPINQGGADIEVDTLFEGVTDTADSRGIYARKVTEKQLEEFIARREPGAAKGSVESLIDERILETTGIPEDIDDDINENNIVVESLNKLNSIKIGLIAALEAEIKAASVIASLNKEYERAKQTEGDLTALETAVKTSLVEAINELEAILSDPVHGLHEVEGIASTALTGFTAHVTDTNHTSHQDIRNDLRTAEQTAVNDLSNHDADPDAHGDIDNKIATAGSQTLQDAKDYTDGIGAVIQQAITGETTRATNEEARIEALIPAGVPEVSALADGDYKLVVANGVATWEII